MLKRIKYHLYLFQLENYHPRRYVGLISRFFRRTPPQLRQELIWTKKLLALCAVAVFAQFVAAMALGIATTNLLGKIGIWVAASATILWFAILSFVFFVFLLLAAMVLQPLDSYLKRRLVRRAAAKIGSRKRLKVIGIVGSYGKTTMKEMISATLRKKYKVLETPENINTPLGIAALILEKLSSDIGVFVVEMGEHEPGDIIDLVRLVRPDFGIITGINEAHLERMGSLEKTVATIFELAEAQGNFPILLNADDALVRDNYRARLNNHAPLFYSAYNNPLAAYVSQDEEFHPDASGISFRLIRDKKDLGIFHTRLLAQYAIGVAVAAVIVGEEFKVPLEEVRATIAVLPPVKHRLELVPSRNGVIVIDDSYNGNPEGVREAIRVLGRFRDRQRVYVTPGLVEMGSRSKEIHYNIGSELAVAATKVILVRTSVTPWIMEGLKAGNFSEKDITVFETAPDAHAALGGMLHAGDVVLFQNDWPDNYS